MTYKITFIGDLTVDKPLLTYSHLGNNKFNFDRVFDKVRDDFAKTDLVVGNLETTLGGSKDFFKTEYMLLNTPDEFVESISKANIDMVVTANNHTLDQNVAGVKRTLDKLDENNIYHTGTYRNEEEFEEVFVKTLGDTKIAIVAGTYGTNESNIDYKFSDKNSKYIDVMKSQEIKFSNSTSGKIKKAITNIFSPKMIRAIRRKAARRKIKKSGQFFNVYIDQIKENDFSNKYFERWIQKIEKAKELADIVFVMPHMGGQFNEEPGLYSEKMMDILLDMDVQVLSNHPHIIQKVINRNGNIGAFSLGGFNMSLSGDYMLKESLPQYSLGFNFYLNDGRIEKISYTIFNIVEYEDKSMEIFPIDKSYEISDSEEKLKIQKEVEIINRRIGLEKDGIKNEYFIK